MKRFRYALPALLLLLLLLPAGRAPAEEAAPPADLFDIYSYGGESMDWLGNAVPVTDGLLVTASANVAGKDGALAVSDGTSAWEVTWSGATSSAGLTVLFYDSGSPAPALGWYRMRTQGSVRAGELSVRTGDERRSRINRAVAQVSPAEWKGEETILARLSDSAGLGSPLLTEDGELAGILVALYGEGPNRYLAATPEQIYRAVAEAAGQLREGDVPLPEQEGFTATAERNAVTFDWSGMDLTAEHPGLAPCLVVTDAGNDYLNYVPITPGEETKAAMLLTPGRTYIAGVDWYEGLPDDVPEVFTVVRLPEAEPLTAYGFRSKVCALALAPEAGLKPGEAPVPEDGITEELLRSGRLYFYSSSSYDVEEPMENLTLLISLTDPTGRNYRHVTGWMYDPALETDDTWYVALDTTGLLDSLNAGGYPPGTYEIAFYVEGELAGRLAFTLP